MVERSKLEALADNVERGKEALADNVERGKEALADNVERGKEALADNVERGKEALPTVEESKDKLDRSKRTMTILLALVIGALGLAAVKYWRDHTT